MSESNFREIQLNTKQVVFLFMACVVALLGVFLLGVQVGHGVSNDGTTAAAGVGEAPTETPVPTPMPPPTTPKLEDFGTYAKLDKTDGKAAPAAASNPPADTPPATTSAVKPAETPAPKTAPAAAPPAKPAAKPAEDKPVSATAVWFVQIDSFGSKENAEKQVAALKSKGQPAFVFTAPGGGAKYKTRIGPMERNAADSLKNRLSREGLHPTVIK